MRFTMVIAGLCIAFSAAAETTEINSAEDQALIQAAENLISEAKKEEAPTVNKPESEIPVEISAAPKAKEGNNLGWRLIMSLGFVAVVGGVLYYATRRWARPKDVQGKGARIEMIHQYHLGPRRSLALIRVAGEAVLVGITDQSINMIKPVTLIDDELEGLMKKDFNNFLEDEFTIEDVRTALQA